ncbi:DUF481 domain-containing protein [candidate division KSB1 bacterium]
MKRSSFPLKTYCLVINLLFIIYGGSVFAQVNTERMRLESEKEGLYFTLDFNLRLKTGNVDIFDSGTGIRIDKLSEDHVTFFVTNIQYASKKSKPYINKGFSHLRYNYRLNDFIKWELFAQHEFNEFTRLFSRTLTGTGFRFSLLNHTKLNINYGSTFMLEHEHLDITGGSDEPNRVRAYRWSNYLVTGINLSDNSNIMNSVYFQPRLDNFSDLRVLNEFVLLSGITDKVQLTVRLNIRYDSKPVIGIKKLDTELLNGVRLLF